MIHAYRDCPWKYHLLYEEDWYISPSPSISLGKSIHGALEQCFLQENPALDVLLELYQNTWVNEGFDTPQQALEYFEKGQAMLEKFWKSRTNENNVVVSVEKEFSFVFGGHRCMGRIDRVDRYPNGDYELAEYKTHAKLWDEKRLTEDLQLNLYAVGCEKSLGFSPKYLSCYFLAHNVKYTVGTDRALMEKALELLSSTVEKIEKKDYAHNSAHCVWCDFKNKCRYSSVQ